MHAPIVWMKSRKILQESEQSKRSVDVLYMAGLYRNYGGEDRFVILATDANQSVIEVHSRMPAVLAAYCNQSARCW